MARDGQQQHPLTNQGDSVGPVPSPDGRKVLFVHYDRTADQADIFATNADGSGTVNLTRTNSANEYNPSWSPDSHRIVFAQSRIESPGRWDVVVMNADGSGLVRLTKTDSTGKLSP